MLELFPSVIVCASHPDPNIAWESYNRRRQRDRLLTSVSTSYVPPTARQMFPKSPAVTVLPRLPPQAPAATM